MPNRDQQPEIYHPAPGRARSFLPLHVERKDTQSTPPAALVTSSASCVVAAPNSGSATSNGAAKSSHGGGSAGGNADDADEHRQGSRRGQCEAGYPGDAENLCPGATQSVGQDHDQHRRGMNQVDLTAAKLPPTSSSSFSDRAHLWRAWPCACQKVVPVLAERQMNRTSFYVQDRPHVPKQRSDWFRTRIGSVLSREL